MKAKRSKYGSVRTVVDGIKFHSRAEAWRYQELRLLEKSGEIRALELQPEFLLYVGLDLPIDATRDPLKLGVYRGDFRYERRLIGAGWHQVVEDVKGMDTPLSKWKRRHVKAQYGITVEIVK